MSRNLFESYLNNNCISLDIVETSEPTHTAIEASIVHKVPVSNIVKSLVVKKDNEFVIVLTPGDIRLDLEYLSSIWGTTVKMANADEVKKVTGYSIGSVPPFGHSKQLKIYYLDSFEKNMDLVAAGGTNNSIFRISLEKLKQYSRAERIPMK